MKKVIALVLVLILALGTFTACGPSKEATKTENPLIVGFLYLGPIGDGGFTYAHDQGRLYLEDYFKGAVKTLYQESIPETVQDVSTAAKNMIDQGAKVIFTTSFGFMDATEALAKEYPDVIFMHFSGYKMNDTNFGNYFGAMEEARYLSGIVAGMKTTTNKIGFVAAFPYTELLIGINAFTLGVQSVNKDATVSVVWTNSWFDPAKEKEAAIALLDQGCDVIAQHCDTTGPQIAAEERGAFAIGYNSDSSAAAPKAFMTAPVWNHGVYYVAQIQKVIDGTWKPESYYGNMADGYIGLLPLTDVAPAGAKEKVAEIQAKIIAGQFPIFTGPIYDQSGKEVVPAGKSLTREEIWKMDYLVKGVQGSLK
ncbi:MAG: BMP family ABC transporter substrate-binding protein [Eubacteriales bacterium]